MQKIARTQVTKELGNALSLGLNGYMKMLLTRKA